MLDFLVGEDVTRGLGKYFNLDNLSGDSSLSSLIASKI
jgi:hypothetical protein